jgi:hypothetical protein
VLADQWLPEATGTEFLARARQLHPAARRVLLITWGDQACSVLVVRPGVARERRCTMSLPSRPGAVVFNSWTRWPGRTAGPVTGDRRA